MTPDRIQGQVLARLATARAAGVLDCPRRSPAGPPDVSVAERLVRMSEEVSVCQRCGLWRARTRTAFGVGNPAADLMFIGEGPGADEDRQGEPFVGKAGQLLNRIIQAIGLAREDVYIANVVKCRPPGNRTPLPDEMASCAPFLEEQIRLVGPRLIVALGGVAAQHLLRTEERISHLRGRFHDRGGIPVIPTFHPAYLLRNPEEKRKVWEDMKKARAFLDALPRR